MIYLDTSVALAQLLSEDTLPPESIWDEPLVSSRLLEYETWTRINREEPDDELLEATRTVLGRVSFIELQPAVLERALDPWPQPLRTLDAIHLATLDYLRVRRLAVSLATYDDRLQGCATKIGVKIWPLD